MLACGGVGHPCHSPHRAESLQIGNQVEHLSRPVPDRCSDRSEQRARPPPKRSQFGRVGHDERSCRRRASGNRCTGAGVHDRWEPVGTPCRGASELPRSGRGQFRSTHLTDLVARPSEVCTVARAIPVPLTSWATACRRVRRPSEGHASARNPLDASADDVLDGRGQGPGLTFPENPEQAGVYQRVRVSYQRD